MAKVYVGNLASSVTSQDLAALFSRAGEVRAALAISDKKSGLCRGFGFVEMAHTDDAVVAASLLNNAELNGRQIKIDGMPTRKSAPREKNGNKSRADRN
jgi:RNA recognition motif-containing protein